MVIRLKHFFWRVRRVDIFVVFFEQSLRIYSLTLRYVSLLELEASFIIQGHALLLTRVLFVNHVLISERL